MAEAEPTETVSLFACFINIYTIPASYDRTKQVYPAGEEYTYPFYWKNPNAYDNRTCAWQAFVER